MTRIPRRIRMVVVLILSFVVSGFIMKYTQRSSSQAAPLIQTQSVVSDFSHSVGNIGAKIISSLTSLRVPSLVSFTSPPSPSTPQQIEPTEPDYNGWTLGPTTPPTDIPVEHPTEIISPVPPTSNPVPSSVQPTKTPKPTNKPKPTPTPELPPVTSDQRPGSNLEEVFSDVSKRMCIPVALLKATQQEESGERYRSFVNSKFSLANRYNWWNEASVTQLDYFNGVAYYTQSGKGPADSKFPGVQIAKAAQPDAYDQQIMGSQQISQQEQEVSRKNTIKILPKNIDRRVLFDNLIIYASITINRVGNSPHPNCNDWPEETVKLAAEKHFGSCNIGGGRNYCTEIWNLYKSFK